MQSTQVRTDWPSLLLSLLAPAVLIAWLIRLATWPANEHRELVEQTLWLLLPLELVRAGLLRAFSHSLVIYGSTGAVRSYLISVVFGLLFVAVMVLMLSWRNGPYEPSLQDIAHFLSLTWVREAFLIPICALIAENVLSLLLFRGNVQAQAARLDAMAADNLDFITIAVVLSTVGAASLVWLDASMQQWSEGALLYAAAFVGARALVLAQVHTARFALTGQRLLARRWVLFWTRQSNKIIDTERDAAEWRRAAMLGEPLP